MLIDPNERQGELSQLQNQASEWLFYALHSTFHTWNISNSSSLLMYHRVRTTAGMTENDAFTAGLDLCLNMTENSSTTEKLSWQPELSPSTWIGLQEVQGINNWLETMDLNLNTLVSGRTSGDGEHSNGPVAKRVSCCPPFCSFLSSLLMMLFSLSPEKVQQNSVGFCFP